MAKIDENRAELLAAAVATSGATIAAAGRSIGLDKTTTYRVSRSPEYRRELARKTLEIADAIVAQSINAHSQAMAVLIDLLSAPLPEIRLNAAKAIIANFSKIHDSAARQFTEADTAIKNNQLMARIDWLTLPQLPSRN